MQKPTVGLRKEHHPVQPLRGIKHKGKASENRRTKCNHQEKQETSILQMSNEANKQAKLYKRIWYSACTAWHCNVFGWQNSSRHLSLRLVFVVFFYASSLRLQILNQIMPNLICVALILFLLFMNVLNPCQLRIRFDYTVWHIPKAHLKPPLQLELPQKFDDFGRSKTPKTGHNCAPSLFPLFPLKNIVMFARFPGAKQWLAKSLACGRETRNHTYDMDWLM